MFRAERVRLPIMDQGKVEEQVAQLPLVAHGLAAIEVLPLVPFTGWELLFATPS